jgi:GTPase
MYPLLNPKFMLVGLIPLHWDKETIVANFEELALLVNTYGGKVYAAETQNISRRDNATYIGSGKAQEIADIIGREKIDIVVINDNIKPGQVYTLKKIFERSNPDILVWDRMELILQIFAKHAQTAEAKLQIKFASIRHMGPRIYGMGFELSQQAGGIGTRGIGETNTELMHRHWRSEIRNIEKQLNKIEKTRTQQMEGRKKDGLMTVSIVGYTNAGKTSLFNVLGRKNNLVENALFATLDSSVCKLYLAPVKREVYLSDTIGFIKNLPPQLIDAFKSTLMETVHADLILHVIDSSDKYMHEKIAVVEGILSDLKVNTGNQIFVFNKTDIAKNLDKIAVIKRFAPFNPVFISAMKISGIDDLLEIIGNKLTK